MSDLTTKFAALEEQLSAQAAATNGLVDTVEAKLQALFDELDIMLINNAANTKALLKAMAQNNPCASCDAALIAVPPTDPTSNPVDEDKCLRTQAFLHAMTGVFTVLDTMSAFGVPFTPSLIGDAINQVAADLENGDTTPLPSFPEMVQIVGDGINYVAGGFLVGDTLVGYYTPLILDLRDAIYAADSPAAAQSAYNALIDAQEGIPGYAKPLMKDAAYNEMWSFYFDPTSGINTTGYDGSVCAPTSDCVTIFGPADAGTSNYTFEGNVYTRIDTNSIEPGVTINEDATYTFNHPVFASYFGSGGALLSADTAYTAAAMALLVGIGPNYFDTSPASATLELLICGTTPL
jgi:hypothetical protein